MRAASCFFCSALRPVTQDTLTIGICRPFVNCRVTGSCSYTVGGPRISHPYRAESSRTGLFESTRCDDDQQPALTRCDVSPAVRRIPGGGRTSPGPGSDDVIADGDAVLPGEHDLVAPAVDRLSTRIAIASPSVPLSHTGS